MFNWLTRNTNRIQLEADNYIESFGEAAYCSAQDAERRAFATGDADAGTFLDNVRLEIARRVDYKPELDIPTDYLDRLRRRGLIHPSYQ